MVSADWVPLSWNGITRGYFYRPTRTYIRDADETHYCIKHQGWGIQREIVDRLRELKCRSVLIKYRNSKHNSDLVLYRTDFQNYVRNGVNDTLNVEDGAQVFLSNPWFSTEFKYATGQEHVRR